MIVQGSFWRRHQSIKESAEAKDNNNTTGFNYSWQAAEYIWTGLLPSTSLKGQLQEMMERKNNKDETKMCP